MTGRVHSHMMDDQSNASSSSRKSRGVCGNRTRALRLPRTPSDEHAKGYRHHFHFYVGSSRTRKLTLVISPEIENVTRHDAKIAGQWEFSYSPSQIAALPSVCMNVTVQWVKAGCLGINDNLTHGGSMLDLRGRSLEGYTSRASCLRGREDVQAPRRNQCSLESVHEVYQGLQSFRNMSRMDASRRKANALRLRFSKSLARRRQRLSQAIVRSTIQRFGRTTKPLA